MDFDSDRVTMVNTNPNFTGAAPVVDESLFEKERARNSFREFIRNFRQGTDYLYRNQLLQRYRRGQHWLEVDLGHLHDYEPRLLKHIQDQPAEYLPVYEKGARDALAQLVLEAPVGGMDGEDGREGGPEGGVPDLQITLKSDQVSRPLRQLAAGNVGRLIKVSGIITSASAVRARAVAVRVQCSQCHLVKVIPAQSGFGGIQLPTFCDGDDPNALGPDGGMDAPGPGAGKCKSRNYVILADESVYIDQQPLKLQESPEMVPTGEMPRSISLSADRYLVDKVAPGTRVHVIGIFSTFSHQAARGTTASHAVKSAYIKAVGVAVEVEGAGRAATSFTPQEEELFVSMARQPDIYEKLASSIAPSISGDYTVDIKKALACQLLSGSRKTLPDGMRLRGDINILMLGDPSTAKSQLLKFIEKVAPVGVYTSGKGSSAAGLTASVIRDSKGEFSLEGGAMVLADGGIVCIDEFDKMRDTDRVAIHEAMEQQTISIAKAGITTVLNTRASVLAAANPIFGRYDDLKSAAENIDLMTTILSRFDLIFIVRDVRDEERDRGIARHVMGVHMNANAAQGVRVTQSAEGGLDMPTIKKFVSYCRQRCAPRLSPEAGQTLASEYVGIRDTVRRRAMETEDGGCQTVPITVRQLEALVRISESLAKMRLSPEVTQEDVREAIRLFQASTGVALAADHSGDPTRNMGFERPEHVARAEEFLKRRIPLGSTTKTSRIQEEGTGQGYSYPAMVRAVSILVRRGDLMEKDQGRVLKRVR